MRRTSTSVISEIRNLKDSNWIERKLLLFSLYLARWWGGEGNPINRKGICKDAVRSFLITAWWHGTAWLYLFIAILLSRRDHYFTQKVQNEWKSYSPGIVEAQSFSCIGFFFLFLLIVLTQIKPACLLHGNRKVCICLFPCCLSLSIIYSSAK